MDRFSDLALFLGPDLPLRAACGRTDYVMITALAMTFTVLTSYTRARAESLIEKCKVGFMERPERIVLFMIGAFTNRMAAVLWVILVLSVLTVAGRIYYTWRELDGPRATEARRLIPIEERLPLPLPGFWHLFYWTYERASLAVRPDGHRDPRVRLAHTARLARRPHGARHGPAGPTPGLVGTTEVPGITQQASAIP